MGYFPVLLGGKEGRCNDWRGAQQCFGLQHFAQTA